MGRPEKVVDPTRGPVQRFAHELRLLRQDAEGPTYREMSRRVHYSVTVLSDAARGDRAPSLEVALAYASACDGDLDAWSRRWEQLQEELGLGRALDTVSGHSAIAGSAVAARSTSSAPARPGSSASAPPARSAEGQPETGGSGKTRFCPAVLASWPGKRPRARAAESPAARTVGSERVLNAAAAVFGVMLAIGIVVSTSPLMVRRHLAKEHDTEHRLREQLPAGGDHPVGSGSA